MKHPQSIVRSYRIPNSLVFRRRTQKWVIAIAGIVAALLLCAVGAMGQERAIGINAMSERCQFIQEREGAWECANPWLEAAQPVEAVAAKETCLNNPEQCWLVIEGKAG